MPDSSLGRSAPLVPPLYQSAVYTLPDLDVLERIMTGEAPGYIYFRDGHPNGRMLAEQLAAAERAEWAVVCSSGMGAITAALLAVVRQGDHVVASNRLYGKTTVLLGQELPNFGVRTTFVDVSDLGETRAALEKPSRVLLVETLSNPLLRTCDLEALAELAHDHNCLLVVDNTFATPMLCRPLELGADMVIESLTKFVGGHSDLMLGLVCGMGELAAPVNQIVNVWGMIGNPFDCWLGARGLATLKLRVEAASANAAALADWLANQPGVAQVIYPGRPDHPDHTLAAKMLHGGFGHMLCFELRDGRDAVNRFLRQAPGIPFSPSLGHTTTTLSHPATTSHRSVSPAERKRQGIGDGLIRLSVGVEDLEQIQRELAKGLR